MTAWKIHTVSKPWFYLTHLLAQIGVFVVLIPTLRYVAAWLLAHRAPQFDWTDELTLALTVAVTNTVMVAVRRRTSGAAGGNRVPTSRQFAEVHYCGDLELAKEIANCVLQHFGSGVKRKDKGGESCFSARSKQGQRLTVHISQLNESEARVRLTSKALFPMLVADGTRCAAHITGLVNGLMSAQEG
jgi:hypothetical protein